MRERLIEAAARALAKCVNPTLSWDGDVYRGDAAAMLAAVLPLIVEAIEAAAEADRRERATEAKEAREDGTADIACEVPHIECHQAAASVSWHEAIRLVRSWAADGARQPGRTDRGDPGRGAR